jgi:hypothetical protein
MARSSCALCRTRKATVIYHGTYLCSRCALVRLEEDSGKRGPKMKGEK